MNDEILTLEQKRIKLMFRKQIYDFAQEMLAMIENHQGKDVVRVADSYADAMFLWYFGWDKAFMKEQEGLAYDPS